MSFQLRSPSVYHEVSVKTGVSAHSFFRNKIKIVMYQARKWLLRSISSLSSHPLESVWLAVVLLVTKLLKNCINQMLKLHQEAEVDIIDRLRAPFGLVHSGVAPYHPETKIVINQFSRVMQHERCSFFGNVTLGSSVSRPELCELYHVVVLAYGVESDRALGIPGEDLLGYTQLENLFGGIMGTLTAKP